MHVGIVPGIVTLVGTNAVPFAATMKDGSIVHGRVLVGVSCDGSAVEAFSEVRIEEVVRPDGERGVIAFGSRP